MLQEKMKQISQNNARDLKIIRKQLKKFPAGSFFCCKQGKYDKWYYRLDNKQIYLPKKERTTAEQLACKRYLTELEQDLLEEKNAADAYLQIHATQTRRSDLLLCNSAYQELLAPFFKSRTQELEDWAKEPYEKNKSHPENMIHKTVSGNMVRSKSEMLIDMALYKNRIPFRYESPLIINNKTYYPDFTIKHPQTGKIYYWEHLGLIDNPLYFNRAAEKIKDYFLD